jgi:hypothetical protein
VHEWVEHPVQTQVVQTAWATMALMYAEYPHREPIEQAIKLVMDRQLPVCFVSTQMELIIEVKSTGRIMGTRGD